MSEILRVESAAKSFGGVRAVKEVSLTIDAGGIVALVGPNGAGKSTLFDLMTGVQRLDRGSRLIDNKDMTRAKSHEIAGAGVARTFQKVRLFNGMTVLENVTVGGLQSHRSIAKSQRAAVEALDRLGLGHLSNREPMELTLIDRKRVEMARALSADPKLLLLDEVMTGLTPQEVEDAIQIITELTESGVTVLLVEHLLRIVMQISRRVLVLDHGEIIADGTPAEVQNDETVVEAYIGTKGV